MWLVGAQLCQEPRSLRGRVKVMRRPLTKGVLGTSFCSRNGITKINAILLVVTEAQVDDSVLTTI